MTETEGIIVIKHKPDQICPSLEMIEIKTISMEIGIDMVVTGINIMGIKMDTEISIIINSREINMDMGISTTHIKETIMDMVSFKEIKVDMAITITIKTAIRLEGDPIE